MNGTTPPTSPGKCGINPFADEESKRYCFDFHRHNKDAICFGKCQHEQLVSYLKNKDKGNKG